LHEGDLKHFKPKVHQGNIESLNNFFQSKFNEIKNKNFNEILISKLG
jgi:hypothetical protein